MHFKTHSADLIETAMFGDQTYMKPGSWTKDKTTLKVPKDNKYFNLVRDKLPDTVTKVFYFSFFVFLINFNEIVE